MKKEFQVDSTEFKRVGSFVSTGAANGREVWMDSDGALFYFSDGGTKMPVSEIAKIKLEDLIIRID